MSIILGRYPHRFANHEEASLSCPNANTLLEYPILRARSFPEGGGPGLDRAIFTFDGARRGDIMLVLFLPEFLYS